MDRNAIFAVAASCALLAACDSSSPSSSPEPTAADSSAALMVASDLHYFSPALMGDTSSPAFQAYLAEDRKMIAQSPELLHSFLDSVRLRKPGVLLITGDLTKDGEKKSHQELADSLATLRRLGIHVYVIPGNHDVYNPEAQAYPAGSSAAVPTDHVTDAEFASIYHDCGFDQALSRDASSLSYVVEPVPGVRLLALDPTRWKDNIGATKETVGGRFLPSTVAWIRTQLRNAADSGKVVVGAMHHGILEHFPYQSSNGISDDYVVAGFDTLDTIFVKGGLHVVFTGHFHANDIASKTFASGVLTDIETGSLVTSPSPFRYGSLSAAGGVAVHTSAVRGIRGFSGDFPAWSRTFLLNGMTQLVAAELQSPQMGSLPATTANWIAPLAAAAYAAHYAGDEPGVPADSTAKLSQIGQSGAAGTKLAGLIQILWTDTKPADSAGVFSLR